MQVHQFINGTLKSNNYLITTAKSPGVWLVDLGSFDQVIKKISPQQRIEGVLLTHYHYDHIVYINELIEQFPRCKIYASPHTAKGLYDPKQNLSFYHESPIKYIGSEPFLFEDGSSIKLFDDIIAKAYTTPGHNPGCMTFLIGDYLFTGDSYIPHLDVVTKLPLGNKTQSLESLKKISALLLPNTTICPGHGPMAKTHEIIDHLTKLIQFPKSHPR
ncbi:MAG: MBL fold metallo-hydrolase [Bacteroidales bacterium]|nr:MBL fold metallo-hydrolase [Bacteroidales bacterium]MBS4069628.1 MBL fold metallo-hydrolase [Sulfurimonas sp.]